MMVAAQYLRDYIDDGFVLIPNVFLEEEVRQIKDRLLTLADLESAACVMEKDGRSIRSIYGVHASDALFRRISMDRRVLALAQQIVGGPVYVHQSKVNFKTKYHGDAWVWHQDFIFWLKEDRILHPNLTTVALFLDDVTEANGPIGFLPGSHQIGVVDVEGSKALPRGYEERPQWISNLTAELKYGIPEHLAQGAVAKYGVRTPLGKKGSLIFFHPNVIHGSAANVSQLDRTILLLTYNQVNNPPQVLQRPWFLCGRDHRALPEDDSPIVT